ncbi:IS3 family transposase [Listeria booriae]|uniref:IS3 family transposase n=1 Tax=Listeria booriae TaxID=1552123 RepID=UPI0035DA4051
MNVTINHIWFCLRQTWNFFRSSSPSFNFLFSFSRRLTSVWEANSRLPWPGKALSPYFSYSDVIQTVVDYISYYNKNRIQQKLDYRSPIEYRQAAV